MANRRVIGIERLEPRVLFAGDSAAAAAANPSLSVSAVAVQPSAVPALGMNTLPATDVPGGSLAVDVSDTSFPWMLTEESLNFLAPATALARTLPLDQTTLGSMASLGRTGHGVMPEVLLPPKEQSPPAGQYPPISGTRVVSPDLVVID